MTSFLAEVHGQSVLRHGQQLLMPENAQQQCKDRPWLTVKFAAIGSPALSSKLFGAPHATVADSYEK
jgi:hypothetical protein